VVDHEGSLEDLAAKLSSGLNAPPFSIGPREDPPHEKLGSLEAFGWQAWLEHSDAIESFRFTLKMETSNSVNEIFNNKIHALSLWLARYVSSICKMDSLASEPRILFIRGKSRELK
jgi:hypothetical protein